MNKRKIEEKFFVLLMKVSTVIVVGSLALILIPIFLKGFPALNLDMLTKTPKGGYYAGKEGGILNAILGSLVLAGGATLLALLVCLPIVFYLNLYVKKRSRFAFSVRFFLDVLWGIPSIVYGAFGFTLMIFFGLRASLFAGMITVAILVLPIMARSMDEVLKMIPLEVKETAFALGMTKWEVATKIIFRQALPGIITAALIGFGRGAGDAASVLFTAGFTDSLPSSLWKPVATLPLAIFFQLGTPFPEVQARGYASALVLTLIVLFISIASRVLSKKAGTHILK